jgi:acyl carrier protein
MHPWEPKFEAILRPHLSLLDTDAALAPDVELRSMGVDSLRLIEVLVSIEDSFDIEFPDELLTGDTFRTPGALWTAVQSLRQGVQI